MKDSLMTMILTFRFAAYVTENWQGLASFLKVIKRQNESMRRQMSQRGVIAMRRQNESMRRQMSQRGVDEEAK